MIVARLCWVSFSAPQDPPECEQVLANAVREYGKGDFIRDFLGLKPKNGIFRLDHFLEIHWRGLFYIAFIFLGIVMLVFDDTHARDAPWWYKVIATMFVF